jgi:adenylate cyclase
MAAGRSDRSRSPLALAYLAPQGIAPRPDANDPARMRLGAASLAPLEAWDGGYAGTDASGYQMLLDYRGAPAGFRRHTLGELLDGRIDETLVRDRIVIVGSSATSLKDFFQTPFSSAALPYVTGSELHAHHASQLLRLADGESRPLRTLPEAIEVVLLALFCVLGLLAWVATRARSLTGLVAGGLAALGVAWYAAAVSAIWFPILPLALGFIVTVSASAGLRALHETRERAAMMTMFSRHVAPEVADELWRRRDELADGYSLRPQHLDATVLFADLHGYSPVAARLAPADTARWLNEFLAPMADVIMAHRGVIRQFAGDAIMAVFGAPIPSETRAEHERDARTSVACAPRNAAALRRAERRMAPRRQADRGFAHRSVQRADGRLQHRQPAAPRVHRGGRHREHGRPAAGAGAARRRRRRERPHPGRRYDARAPAGARALRARRLFRAEGTDRTRGRVSYCGRLR